MVWPRSRVPIPTPIGMRRQAWAVVPAGTECVNHTKIHDERQGRREHPEAKQGEDGRADAVSVHG